MSRGLHLSLQLRGSHSDAEGLSGEAFRLVLEKPSGWEGRLFARLASREIANAADLRRDYESGIAFGPGDVVLEAAVSHWIGAFIDESQRFLDALNKIVATALNNAFETSDVASITYGARQVGRAYRESLEWAARLRRVHLPDDWRPIARELSVMLADITREIERFVGSLERQIDEILAAPDAGPKRLKLTFNIHIPEMERFHTELANFKRKRGIR
jgi:hypothetical protein